MSDISTTNFRGRRGRKDSNDNTVLIISAAVVVGGGARYDNARGVGAQMTSTHKSTRMRGSSTVLVYHVKDLFTVKFFRKHFVDSCKSRLYIADPFIALSLTARILSNQYWAIKLRRLKKRTSCF